MSFLLDTSFLSRLVNVNDKVHPHAVAALTELFRRGESLFISSQNLVEFWSVATRPTGSPNGLGMSPQTASEIVDVFTREFELATETPDILTALRKLLGQVEVVGKQVHDARLVAICHVHQITGLVTFNPRHFRRFGSLPPGVEIAEPADIVRGTA